MIHIGNLTFTYDKAPVLQGVTFHIHEPVITGLWGRNGAGKTTLMNLLAGHEQVRSGTVKIMGMEPWNNSEAVQQICYMKENHPFSLLWNVSDALRFAGYFHENWDMEMAEKLLKIFKLDEKKKISKLSKGMKSSLCFIIGLASNAAVTILDEPINGLDAGMRKIMYEVLMKSHADHPRAIFLSTHHIEEVQPVCEDLIVLHEGRLVFHKSLEEIRKKGVWLSGVKEKVNQLANGSEVLESNEAGKMMKVMLDVPFSDDWKEKAQAHTLHVEKAKIQDYLLNITKEKNEVITV